MEIGQHMDLVSFYFSRFYCVGRLGISFQKQRVLLIDSDDLIPFLSFFLFLGVDFDTGLRAFHVQMTDIK